MQANESQVVRARNVTKKKNFQDIPIPFPAHTGEDPYLFVSYSHEEKREVYPIIEKLHDKKFRFWYDAGMETGNDFRQELYDRIVNSEAVLLFVSKTSMASRFCGMEIIVAYQHGKRIFPVFLDKDEGDYEEIIPAPMKMVLEQLQYVNSNDPDLVDKIIPYLPAAAMDRIEEEDGVLVACEDHGDTVEVKEGVVRIKHNAFEKKRSLRRIKLPETLEVIETESFRGCSSLEAIAIPQRTTSIGESAFRDCTEMHTLTISNNTIKIGERAFENCAKLECVSLPEGLTEIYGGVFNSCKSLTSIELPPSLTILGESAFSDCDHLKEIRIPEKVTKIDDLVFNGCTALKKIELNEGLKKIGKSAFKNCGNLTEIVLPRSLSYLSEAPFRGCKMLRSIRVDAKNKYYKSEPTRRDGEYHVLFNKNKSILIAYPASSQDVSYEIPDSVVSICEWAFCESRELSRITIPDSVQEINEGAFANCQKLNLVTVPDSVTKIDDCAFRGCSSLSCITIPASVSEFGWGVFDGCDEKLVVYGEEGSLIQQYCENNGIEFKPVIEKEAD